MEHIKMQGIIINWMYTQIVARANLMAPKENLEVSEM